MKDVTGEVNGRPVIVTNVEGSLLFSFTDLEDELSFILIGGYDKLYAKYVTGNNRKANEDEDEFYPDVDTTNEMIERNVCEYIEDQFNKVKPYKD